jgi:hypothetical protein
MTSETGTEFDPPLAVGADVYRRRILVRTAAPGEVVCDLEDDFHHFRVTLRHDHHMVESVDAESIRWPSRCARSPAHRSPPGGRTRHGGPTRR